MRIARHAVLGLAALALAACGGAKEDPAPTPAPAPAANDPVATLEYSEMPPTSSYKLTGCVMCDKPLRAGGNTPYVIAYRGYEVQLCGKDCLKPFAVDPETVIVQKINPKAIFTGK